MPRTYLFALTDGGGTVPPEVGAARRLVERGHRARVLAEDSMAPEVRATGAGAAATVGRLASIVAPLFTPWALEIGGSGLAFTVFAICFAVAAASAWGLNDLKGRSLSEVDAAAQARARAER